ncbi:MAG: glycosyltransferase [Candidatus Jordarchaeaceae archaeon]
MNVTLAHLSLNFIGGEERLCLSFIDALKKSGHHVTLFTLEKTSWKEVKRFFGGVTMPDKEIFLTSSPIHSMFSKAFIPIYSYVKYLRGLAKLVSQREYDVVVNTYGDMFTSIADLSYVHFPINATFDYHQIPAFSSSRVWKTYLQMYEILSKIIDKVRPSFLLTNSKFTKYIIKQYLSREALVLHPPVDVKKYWNENIKRKNYVITVSKFTPKRNLHIIPLIAQLTKNVKFFIIGKADKYSLTTIKKLLQYVKYCGVKDRVIPFYNIPESNLINLLSNAKIYLHTVPFEHFGISIVEAMASGCIPLVHRSGGPWLDILNQQQGKNGFSYATVEEAAQLIDTIMNNEDVYKAISMNARKRATRYDVAVFQEKLNAMLKQMGGEKTR